MNKKPIRVLCINDYFKNDCIFTKGVVYNATIETYDDCILLSIFYIIGYDGYSPYTNEQRFVVKENHFTYVWEDYHKYFCDINKFERKQKLERLNNV